MNSYLKLSKASQRIEHVYGNDNAHCFIVAIAKVIELRTKMGRLNAALEESRTSLVRLRRIHSFENVALVHFENSSVEIISLTRQAFCDLYDLSQTLISTGINVITEGTILFRTLPDC